MNSQLPKSLLIITTLLFITSASSDLQAAGLGNYKTLPAGTQVNLVLLEEIHSNRNKIGDEVVFAVADDVAIQGKIFLVEGTPVIGSVTKARPARSWGRGGYIDAEISTIAPIYSDPIPLRGSPGESGGSDTATSVGATIIIGLSVVGILAGGALSGDTAVLDAGTQFTVFTAANAEVHNYSDNQKRSQVEQWYDEKVKTCFLQYTWDDYWTVSEAINYLGYNVDKSDIDIEPVEDYEFYVDVDLNTGRSAEFSFRPFQEPYIGKWMTLKGHNYEAERIIDAVGSNTPPDDREWYEIILDKL